MRLIGVNFTPSGCVPTDARESSAQQEVRQESRWALETFVGQLSLRFTTI